MLLLVCLGWDFPPPFKSLTYIFVIDRYYTLAVKKHCKVLVNFSELTE